MLLYPILCFGPMVMAVVCYVLGRASKSKRDLLMMATVTTSSTADLLGRASAGWVCI